MLHAAHCTLYTALSLHCTALHFTTTVHYSTLLCTGSIVHYSTVLHFAGAVQFRAVKLWCVQCSCGARSALQCSVLTCSAEQYSAECSAVSLCSGGVVVARFCIQERVQYCTLVGAAQYSCLHHTTLFCSPLTTLSPTGPRLWRCCGHCQGLGSRYVAYLHRPVPVTVLQ
jgi:hypothetical protein